MRLGPAARLRNGAKRRKTLTLQQLGVAMRLSVQRQSDGAHTYVMYTRVQDGESEGRRNIPARAICRRGKQIVELINTTINQWHRLNVTRSLCH